MNTIAVRRLSKQLSSRTVLERETPVDELNAIINTFEGLVEWLEGHLSAAGSILKEQTEKFKKKILQLKDLNKSSVPVRHR